MNNDRLKELTNATSKKNRSVSGMQESDQGIALKLRRSDNY